MSDWRVAACWALGFWTSFVVAAGMLTVLIINPADKYGVDLPALALLFVGWAGMIICGLNWLFEREA